MIITKPDGTEDHLSFRSLTSGEEVVNSVSGAEMRNRCRWAGRELLIESFMKVGERYWALSSDGRELIMEHRGDDLAGQITFLERTGREHADVAAAAENG